MAYFIATMILILIEGGTSSGERTRTPIEPESPREELGLGFGLGPG